MEVVGLAGAGKSTLSQALYRQDLTIVASDRLRVRNLRRIPFMVSQAFLLLPTLFGRPRNGRWFTMEEVKQLIYLKGWNRVLRRQSTDDNRVILIDQGPVFKLATLRGFGPDQLKSRGFVRWWDTMFNKWANTLDMIVWLNAPDEVLLKRICARDKSHLLKRDATREGRNYLSIYRSCYEYVIDGLTAHNTVRLLHFDTSRQSIERIIKQVLMAFDEKHNL